MSALDFIVEEAISGQLVILIGLDLKSDATNLPSGSELAQKIKPPASVAATLAQAAQQVGAPGAWTYVNVLKADLRGKPLGPLHTLIASLPVPYLMTSAYDDGLRKALEKANRKANLLVCDGDLNERQAGQPDLIKLCGDLERDDVPLVVTSNDYVHYHSGLPKDNPRHELTKWYGRWLEKKTVVLVGCNPASGSDFELLYRRVIREGSFKVRAYLIWPGPVADAVKKYWEAQNVTIVADEATAFLGALAERLNGAQIMLPADPDQANLERIARLLGIGAPPREIETVLNRLPPERRPRQIVLTFRLWLDQSKLCSMLTVQSEPDVLGGKPLLERNTNITFDELDEWTRLVEQDIRTSQPLGGKDSTAQQKAIEFFNKLVPPDSDESKRYALAQSAATILKAPLTFVFEFAGQDNRVVTIPWELLHDGQVADVGRGFLSLKYRLYRHSAYAASVEQVTGKIEKALIISADPTTIKLAGLNQEVSDIAKILGKAKIQVDQCAYDAPDLRSPEKLKSLIRAGNYQLLHYTGHAQFVPSQPSKSRLVLSRPSKEWDGGLTAEALAEAARETGLILVVLSACEGAQEFQVQEQPWQEAGLMDAFARAGVPAVLAMRWIVGSPNSRAMVETFYTHLRKGESIECALMYARQEVKGLKGGQADWANPVLAKRHGVLAE